MVQTCDTYDKWTEDKYIACAVSALVENLVKLRPPSYVAKRTKVQQRETPDSPRENQHMLCSAY